MNCRQINIDSFRFFHFFNPSNRQIFGHFFQYDDFNINIRLFKKKIINVREKIFSKNQIFRNSRIDKKFERFSIRRKYSIENSIMEKSELIEIKKGKTGTGLLIENDGYISMDNGHNKVIKEEFDNSGEWNVPCPFIVDAVFQKYDVKNANGRVYPEKTLKKQVEVYQQKIAEHRAYGELNHPSESTIDLGRVSHNIIELHWEGRTLVGKLELNLSRGFIKEGIVSTMGDMTATLLLNGYKIGVSSRGVGSVENKLGTYMVGNDFELICWDIVSDPSTPGAYIGKKEELQQYVESTENKKSKINEKVNKIQSILKS